MPRKNDFDFDDIRLECGASFYAFACYVEPHRVYGKIHEDVCYSMQFDEESHKLYLLPRDHQKSHLMAVYVAWRITIDPTITVLYCSATAALAESQLREIKNILTCVNYRRLWPEMIHPQEAKRAKWAEAQLIVDHPLRHKTSIRDETVRAVGLTSNTTGFHCDLVVFDDIVVPSNAYTGEGRRKVDAAYSQYASIMKPEAEQMVVGTRYHEDDIYAFMMSVTYPYFIEKEENGEIKTEYIEDRKLYKSMIKEVELGGVFLWPRVKSANDNKYYGFNEQILAKKRAQYRDKRQFWAQYYNDTSPPETQRISRSSIKRYKLSSLNKINGRWHYKNRLLNIYAAVDLAFSTKRQTDYTAIVVIGIDYEDNIYVLDINRKKIDKANVYYDLVIAMHNKWNFNLLAIETSGSGEVISSIISDKAKSENMRLRIKTYKPNRHGGTKKERTQQFLEPRYMDKTIYHGEGGLFPVYEEELIHDNPKHDDIRDAATMCVMIAKRPHRTSIGSSVQHRKVVYNKKYGGVASRVLRGS